MTHILHTSTVHKTSSIADEGNSVYFQSSVAAHNNTEISIERSPLHWGSSEGSNSESFAQENNALTARPHVFLSLSKSKAHGYTYRGSVRGNEAKY